MLTWNRAGSSVEPPSKTHPSELSCSFASILVREPRELVPSVAPMRPR